MRPIYLYRSMTKLWKIQNEKSIEKRIQKSAEKWTRIKNYTKRLLFDLEIYKYFV